MRRVQGKLFLFSILSTGICIATFAQEAPKHDPSDTSWLDEYMVIDEAAKKRMARDKYRKSIEELQLMSHPGTDVSRLKKLMDEQPENFDLVLKETYFPASASRAYELAPFYTLVKDNDRALAYFIERLIPAIELEPTEELKAPYLTFLKKALLKPSGLYSASTAMKYLDDYKGLFESPDELVKKYIPLLASEELSKLDREDETFDRVFDFVRSYENTEVIAPIIPHLLRGELLESQKASLFSMVTSKGIKSREIAVEAYKHALDSENSETSRGRAISSFTTINPDPAQSFSSIQGIISAQGENQLSKDATLALSNVNIPAVRDYLHAQLSSGSDFFADSATLSLANRDDLNDKTAQMLLAAMEDDKLDPFSQRLALEMISRRPDAFAKLPAAVDSLIQEESLGTAAAVAAANFGKSGEEAIQKAYRSPSSMVRSHAVAGMGYLANSDLSRVLLDIASADEDSRVRRAALNSMAKKFGTRDVHTQEKIFAALKDVKTDVNGTASYHILKEMGSDTQNGVLDVLLDLNSEILRTSVGLGVTYDSFGERYYNDRIYSGENNEAETAAMAALEKIMALSDDPALMLALIANTHDDPIKLTALVLLSKVKGKSEAATDVLSTMLHNAGTRVEFNDNEFHYALIESLVNVGHPAKKVAKILSDNIDKALKDDEPSILFFQIVANSAGKLGPETIPMFEKMLDRDHPFYSSIYYYGYIGLADVGPEGRDYLIEKYKTIGEYPNGIEFYVAESIFESEDKEAIPAMIDEALGIAEEHSKDSLTTLIRGIGQRADEIGADNILIEVAKRADNIGRKNEIDDSALRNTKILVYDNVSPTHPERLKFVKELVADPDVLNSYSDSGLISLFKGNSAEVIDFLLEELKGENPHRPKSILYALLGSNSLSEADEEKLYQAYLKTILEEEYSITINGDFDKLFVQHFSKRLLKDLTPAYEQLLQKNDGSYGFVYQLAAIAALSNDESTRDKALRMMDALVDDEDSRGDYYISEAYKTVANLSYSPDTFDYVFQRILEKSKDHAPYQNKLPGLFTENQNLGSHVIRVARREYDKDEHSDELKVAFLKGIWSAGRYNEIGEEVADELLARLSSEDKNDLKLVYQSLIEGLPYFSGVSQEKSSQAFFAVKEHLKYEPKLIGALGNLSANDYYPFLEELSEEEESEERTSLVLNLHLNNMMPDTRDFVEPFIDTFVGALSSENEEHSQLAVSSIHGLYSAPERVFPKVLELATNPKTTNKVRKKAIKALYDVEANHYYIMEDRAKAVNGLAKRFMEQGTLRDTDDRKFEDFFTDTFVSVSLSSEINKEVQEDSFKLLTQMLPHLSNDAIAHMAAHRPHQFFEFSEGLRLNNNKGFILAFTKRFGEALKDISPEIQEELDRSYNFRQFKSREDFSDFKDPEIAKALEELSKKIR